MRQRKYFIIENLIVFAICFEVLGITLLLMSCTVQHGAFVINRTLFNLSWCIIIIWITPFVIAHKRKIGENEIEPNVISVNNIDEYFERLTQEFTVKERIVLKNSDDNVLFIYGKKRGAAIRITIVEMENFDKEKYKEIKRRANRYINKKYEISQYTPISGPRNIRVNVVITDSENEATKKITRKNADELFGRVEPILNVFAYKNNQTINVPAHFGISGIYQYNKIWRILNRFAGGTK